MGYSMANDCMNALGSTKQEEALNMSPSGLSHTQTHPHMKTVSVKDTDCCSARMDHEHAGKVSFVLSVKGFPSALSMNDVPYGRKTAGGCEIDINLLYHSFPSLALCQTQVKKQGFFVPSVALVRI